MSSLVINASVVVAWFFDNEDEPRADRGLNRLVENGALVPQLWHLRDAQLPAHGRTARASFHERGQGTA